MIIATLAKAIVAPRIDLMVFHIYVESMLESELKIFDSVWLLENEFGLHESLVSKPLTPNKNFTISGHCARPAKCSSYKLYFVFNFQNIVICYS